MNSENFFRWCTAAVSKIKYRPDRDEVHRELYAHLEDSYDAYIAKGFTPQEAESKALTAMGNAADTAVQLAAVHRSILPYILIATRCLAIVLAISLVVSMFRYFGELSISNDRIVAVCGYDPYEDAVGAKPGYAAQRIYYDKRSAETELNGYQICVEGVALWRLLDEKRDVFHIEISVRNYRPWASPPEFIEKFWARDDLGNTYACFNAYPAVTDAFIGVTEERIGIFTYRYDLQLVDFVYDGVRWVELCYDQDGRDIVQRVYLNTTAEGSQ